MKYLPLGSSPLEVSAICLGTMTWGQQNTQADADLQIDYALDSGINFIDTAEMYSIPPKPETQGSTERIIGNWLQANPAKREKIILASKIAGNNIPWLRDGGPITGAAVVEAVDQSLARLKTDYIDLYQLHWPNRLSPHFSKHWPGMLPLAEVNAEQQKTDMLEILQGLDRCVKAGKIRHCGLSNETPWGIASYLALSEQHNLPRMVSIQNEFSLLHWKDSPYLLESCINSNVAYLPWSPLAGGALSGKYRHGKRPENCRWTMAQRNGIFRDTTQTEAAIEAYWQVAEHFNLSLAQMSLAWVYQCQGVTSTIIGATSMDQLKENVSAYTISLNEKVMAEIERVMKQYPIPF